MNAELVKENKKKKMHPHKFLMWIAIASIVMMFAGLTSAFIIKSNQVSWVGIDLSKYFWYSTIVILVSSLTIHLATKAIQQKNMRTYRLFVAITFFLGILFVVFQSLGFEHLWNVEGIHWKGSGAGQFLYIIFGLHALHVIGGIVALLIIFVRAFFGKTRVYSSNPIEVAGLYWHFVDVLWVYLFIFFMVIGK